MYGHTASHTVLMTVVLLLGVVASVGAQRSKSGTPEPRDVIVAPATLPAPPADRRTALVIGNAAYTEAPLANPVNDATDMAGALQKMGFDVTLLPDADLRRMREALETFRQQLRPGVVGLFYFAGHGLQVKGENYLVPIGARIAREQDVEFETLQVGRILGAMGDAANDINVIILDACRNTPFARSVRAFQRGLAVTQAITGSLIAYATAPGSVAADGSGRNGVYTSHLLRNMRMPNVPIEQVFKNVRIGVMQETSAKQTPWETSSLTGSFMFTSAADKPAPGPTSPQPPMPGQAVPLGAVPSLATLQAHVEAQRQQVQAERQQLEEARRRWEEAQTLQAEQERLLREESQTLQAEQERLRQEREKLQGGGAPQGPQVAVGGHPRPAEAAERRSRDAEQAEPQQREHSLVAQGMKFIVKQQFLCLNAQDNLVLGTTTLTGASSLSCEDARGALMAEYEKKKECSSPSHKEGQKQWIGTASCPAP